MRDIYLVNCCRTAVGSMGGSLKDTPAPELGAIVIKEALKRAGLDAANVDEVMMGCTLVAAMGQNPARQAAVKAGVPVAVPAYTVSMVCGSGMKAVIEAARAIAAGDAEVIGHHRRERLRHLGHHPRGAGRLRLFLPDEVQGRLRGRQVQGRDRARAREGEEGDHRLL